MYLSFKLLLDLYNNFLSQESQEFQSGSNKWHSIIDSSSFHETYFYDLDLDTDSDNDRLTTMICR